MKQGDIIILNTQNKSWRGVTIQPYHKQKAKIISLSETSDLMTVRLLSPASFKKAHPSLSTEFVYMPKWAAKKTNLMEPE